MSAGEAPPVQAFGSKDAALNVQALSASHQYAYIIVLPPQVREVPQANVLPMT
jgi:hypothetical protein